MYVTLNTINGVVVLFGMVVSEKWDVGFDIDMVHSQLYELGGFHVVYHELYHPFSNCEAIPILLSIISDQSEYYLSF